MKSRGVYETPGGTILMAASRTVRRLILDRDTMEAKKKLGSQLCSGCIRRKMVTPLREAIQAFVESTQKYVTGEVKFKLYKGNIIKAGTTSPYSLYNESLASFTTGDIMITMMQTDSSPLWSSAQGSCYEITGSREKQK